LFPLLLFPSLGELQFPEFLGLTGIWLMSLEELTVFKAEGSPDASSEFPDAAEAPEIFLFLGGTYLFWVFP